MIGLGTVTNVVAILVGGILGVIFKNFLKQRYKEILLTALGVSTLILGASGTLKGMLSVKDGEIQTSGEMMIIISLVVGSLIGELINIEKIMENFGLWIKSKVKVEGGSRFVEGFVNASIIVCVGAMAIVGSINEGVSGDSSILFAKSMLDFVLIVIFASTLGKGVIFSAIPLGLYQGLLTLLSSFIAPVLNDNIVGNISTVGSILVFCIGVNIAFNKKIKVGNMLPSIVIAVIFGMFA